MRKTPTRVFVLAAAASALLCLAAPAGRATAQGAEAAGRPASLVYADGGHSSGWIPFQLHRGTHILLPATVNGRSVTALLDSGASEMVLDTRFAEGLGLHGDGKQTMGAGVEGSAPSGEVGGVTVGLGRLTITPEKTVTVDESAAAPRFGFEQTLAVGGAALRDTVVDIDFAGGRLSFNDPAAYTPPRGAAVLPLKRFGDLRTVELSVEGRPLQMLVDLGNGSAVLLYRAFWDRPEFLAGRRTADGVGGGWVGSKPRKLAMLRSLKLGPADFTQAPAVLLLSTAMRAGNGATLLGNVGLPVLRRFHLVLDFPHDRLILAPPMDTATPFRINHTGLTLRKTAGGEEIAFVAPGSPAARLGLKAGQVVTAVRDGGAPLDVDGDWTTSPQGRRLSLTLADGASTELETAAYF